MVEGFLAHQSADEVDEARLARPAQALGAQDALDLGEAGFDVETVAVRARQNGKGPRHTIWLATKR